MPRENMAPSPEDVPGSSVATREHTLRSMAREAPGEVASQKSSSLLCPFVPFSRPYHPFSPFCRSARADGLVYLI